MINRENLVSKLLRKRVEKENLMKCDSYEKLARAIWIEGQIFILEQLLTEL